MSLRSILRQSAAALVLILGAMSLPSCSNEVDVIGEWKEIPIVYGILRTQDTATYLRIEKAYLPPSTDARQVAQNPDSLYFGEDDIEVKLFQNGVEFATLERVDGALEGYPRDTGVFAQSPNILYKTRRPLANNATYRLEIASNRTGETYIATTETINSNGILITTPTAARPVRWSFFDANAHVLNSVKFDWREPDNADIYDLTIDFKYAEFEVDDFDQEISGTRQYKSLRWKPITSYIPDGVVQREVSGEAFYRFIARSLAPTTGTRTRRCATNMDVFLTMGGEDLALYIKARGANSGVVGGLFPVEPYSNISGGYGIFSSTYQVSRLGIAFEPDVYKYLNEGEITNTLGFRPTPCD